MNMKSLAPIFLIAVFFYSCGEGSNPQEFPEKITIYDYQIWLSDLDRKELRDSMVVYRDSLYYDDQQYIVYLMSFEDTTHTYPYYIENDSLFFWDIYCPDVDTIEFIYNREKISVIKSEYDVERSYDEESDIYWNPDYGLIAQYSYPWGALILFEKEKMPGFAKDLFYNYIINLEKQDRKRRE